MTGIAQHELERMLAGRQFDTCLGLTRSKMKMGFILRDRFVGIERFVDVNEQVMVSAVLKVVTGMGYAHVAQAETAPKPAFDCRAVLRPYEIKQAILACRLSLAVGRKRQ